MTALARARQAYRTEWGTATGTQTQRFPRPSVTRPLKPLPKLHVGGSNPLARFLTPVGGSCQRASFLRPAEDGSDTVSINLNKGNNDLVISVAASPREWACFASVSGMEDEAIEGLEVKTSGQ